MKNLILGALVGLMCFTFTPTTHAQDEAGFAPNHFYADIGIGFRNRYYSGVTYNYDYYRLPAFTANLQYGFDMFSAGLFLGYTHNGFRHTSSYGYYDEYGTYNSGIGDYEERTSRINIGASFSWHVWYFLNHKLDLGLGVEALDLYVTAMVGAQVRPYFRETPKYGRRSSVSSVPFVGAKVGAKYYFLKNLGAFAEFGSGLNSISYVSLGLALKF